MDTSSNLASEMRTYRRERIFCQIVGRDISTTRCLVTQGQDECFMCAAPSRLCEKCGKSQIDVPVTGLCALCLSLAIRDESLIVKKPEISVGMQVNCKMQKKSILATTCLRLQSMGGEFEDGGCRNCAEPTYLCEYTDCIRPAAIRRAGLCLIHAVEEYGDGWEVLSDEEMQPMGKEISESQNSKHDEDRDDQTITVNNEGSWCVMCGNRPIYIKKRKLCTRCVIKVYAQEAMDNPKRREPLLHKTREFLKNAPDAGKNALRIRLGVDHHLAGFLWEHVQGEQNTPHKHSSISSASDMRGDAKPKTKSANLCVKCNDRPLYSKARKGLCRKCSGKEAMDEFRQNTTLIEYYMEMAQNFLAEKKAFTFNELRRHMHISVAKARVIVEESVARGWIHRPIKREKLYTAVTVNNMQQNAFHDQPADGDSTVFTLEEQKEGLKRLIDVIGAGSKCGLLLSSVSRTIGQLREFEEKMLRVKERLLAVDKEFYPLLEEFSLIETDE